MLYFIFLGRPVGETNYNHQPSTDILVCNYKFRHRNNNYLNIKKWLIYEFCIFVFCIQDCRMNFPIFIEYKLILTINIKRGLETIQKRIHKTILLLKMLQTCVCIPIILKHREFNCVSGYVLYCLFVVYLSGCFRLVCPMIN